MSASTRPPVVGGAPRPSRRLRPSLRWCHSLLLSLHSCIDASHVRAQMRILTCDLWPDVEDRELGSTGTSGLISSPGSRPCWSLGRMQAWFAERPGLVRRLTIRLLCSDACCNLSELGGALVAVLLSCAASLESLQLEVHGAPLLACSICPRLAAASGAGHRCVAQRSVCPHTAQHLNPPPRRRRWPPMPSSSKIANTGHLLGWEPGLQPGHECVAC